MHLLCALAAGHDEGLPPDGMDITAWRAEVEKARTVDPAEKMRELDQWARQACGEGERRVRQMRRDMYDHAEALRCMEAELAACDAARAELPRLRTLPTAADPYLRTATAYLLGFFPEEAAGSLTALEAPLARETVPEVLAKAFISIALLSGTGLIPRLREHLDGPDPLLRWAAALSLARMDHGDPKVITALVAALTGPAQDAACPPFRDDRRTYAALSLARLGDRLPEQAVDAMLECLARASQLEACAMIVPALRMAFPQDPPRPRPPFAELTERQQRVVRLLAEKGPETWRWSNFTGILRAWNPPGDPAGCRTYAGLTASQ